MKTAFESDQKWISLWRSDREQLYRFAQLRVKTKVPQLESLIVPLVLIFCRVQMPSASDGLWAWTQVPLLRHAAVPKWSGINVRALHGKPGYWQPNKRHSADSSLCGSGQEATSRIIRITIIRANFAAVNSPQVWSQLSGNVVGFVRKEALFGSCSSYKTTRVIDPPAEQGSWLCEPLRK